ncbi:MAG: energy transducer TonB [Blastocatellales bacterium]
MSQKITLLIVLTILVVAPAPADSWRLPKEEKYYSPDKKYFFLVTPKKLESQLRYFEEKVDGKDNAGALKKVKDNLARGTFYVRRAKGGYSKKWEFTLLNEVSPVNALVSNKGDFVVTFDNWHGVGYGDDVVVIYRSNGTLIKKFGLKDLLTEGDIETLPRSVSSIWWGGEHYIDEAHGLLILKVVSNSKSSWDKEARFRELKIELATGHPLEMKRDLFPQLRVFGSVDAGTTPMPSDASPGKPTCFSAKENFDSPEAVRVPSEQFYEKAKERPLPSYPPIAKAVRAESSVIVEILVSKGGEVICARSLSGHPLLREAAVAAVLKWKFEPIEASGDSTGAVGTVSINFKLTEKDVNLNNQPQ